MKVWDRSEIGEEENTTGEKLTNSVGYGSTFLGIKLENENFKEIISVEWGTDCKDKGRWMYSDVPKGQSIVGL